MVSTSIPLVDTSSAAGARKLKMGLQDAYVSAGAMDTRLSSACSSGGSADRRAWPPAEANDYVVTKVTTTLTILTASSWRNQDIRALLAS